ncbi:MAG: YjgN family protein [Nitrospinota bacterium]|nr:YjgN family protein [Nitrospinota bacterium]
MSCFLTLSAFVGDDQEAAAKKLALMFRMAPQQAHAILDKVSKGETWQTPKGVPDKQAAVAENYLKAIGFRVERSGQQAVVDQIAGAVALEEPPSSEAGQGFEGNEGEEMAGGPPGQPPRTGSRLRPPGNGGGKNQDSTPPQGLPIGFHGTGGGLFKIMLINWVLTILTLGIYYFWGKTKVRRYLCEQSSFAGDRFYYHGTGGELFKGAVIFGFILTLLNLGIMAIGSAWGPQAEIAAQIGSSYIIVVLLPVIMVGAFRYRLSRTAWRGIRLSFRGMRKSALWLYVKGYLLTALTLGLYWPYFTARKQQFWRSNAYFGNQSFKYEGDGKDILKAFLMLILLFVGCVALPAALPILAPEIFNKELATVAMGVMWIPLVIGYMSYSVYLDRYNWSKTQFAGASFNYDATTWQWIILQVTNFLIIVCTLGLGFPWATIRSRKFLADHLAVAGNMQLSQVVQDAQKSSALGEGAADGFDMDIDIGI